MSTHPVESLSAFLDDELPDAERRGIEAHLAACPSCARHLHELAAVDALARGLPPAGAPDGYLETLPGRVRRRIRADRPARAIAPWVLPLAAGLFLAVLSPLVLRYRSAPELRPVERPPLAMEQPAAPATIAAPPGRAKLAAPRDAMAEREAEGDTLAGAGAPAPRRVAPRVDAVAPRDPVAAPAVPPAAARPAEAPAERADARKNQAARELARRDEAGADAPGFAPPPAAAPALEEKMTQDQDQGAGVDERPQTVGAAAATLGKREGTSASAPSREERAFRALAALPLSTAGQARHARGAWLHFLTDYPRGERRDEALVRVVEASVAAFRDGADPGDRLRARQDGEAYLSRSDAPQAARVEAALRRLDDPR